MTHAFDRGAFDSIAFDCDPEDIAGGFAYAISDLRGFPIDDDDLLLAAWFAFMRQPHE